MKVTPSSKVVGDLALFLVSHDMTTNDLLNLSPDHQVTLPNSVADMFMGSLGQPEGGWPPKLQQIVLRGQQPMSGRSGEQMEAVDLAKAEQEMFEKTGSRSRTDLMSYLMYPEVFVNFARARTDFGELEVLPTLQFFYGLEERCEVTVDLEPGKTLIIRLLTVGEPRPDGMRTLFFELNGQPREVEIADKLMKSAVSAKRMADPGKTGEVGAPIPGAIGMLHVQAGEHVKKGSRLLVMEAMKMQTTVYAPVSGVVKEVLVHLKSAVEARELLLTIEADS